MDRKTNDTNKTQKHITGIGGQALIEGIMMRGPKLLSIAIRKPDQEIELKVDPLNTLGMRHKFFRLPLIRGCVGLVEAMGIGQKALMYSAEFIEDGNDEKDKFLDKIFKSKADDIRMMFTVILSVLIAVGAFMVLPSFLTNYLRKFISNNFLMNLVEGVIRIALFLTYIIAISRTKDIARVFQYHGAEHKSIHCYESGLDLTVENVKKFSVLHPRCGTSFLFMVMIVSIVVLSFFGWPNPWMRLLIRLVMLPVIAGISYEINKMIGKSESGISYCLSWPGLMLQKYATVKEPDDSMIEVAIVALKEVIPENKQEDSW